LRGGGEKLEKRGAQRRTSRTRPKISGKRKGEEQRSSKKKSKEKGTKGAKGERKKTETGCVISTIAGRDNYVTEIEIKKKAVRTEQ